MSIEDADSVLLTVVDLCDGVSGTRHRRRCCVKALQPVTHSRLGIPIVPQDINSGCIKIIETSVKEISQQMGSRLT